MPLHLTREELFEFLDVASVSDEQRCVGLEWEKEAVDSNGQRVVFHGERGIEAILKALARDHAWNELDEAGHVVALERQGESITLEPGGQVEYATPPRRRLC